MVPGLCSSSIWATCSTNLTILVVHSQNLVCRHRDPVLTELLDYYLTFPCSCFKIDSSRWFASETLLKWSISSKNVFSSVLTKLWSNRPQVASWDTDVWALVKRLGIWKNWGDFRAAAFSQWVKNLSKNKTTCFVLNKNAQSWLRHHFGLLTTYQKPAEAFSAAVISDSWPSGRVGFSCCIHALWEW